jgi:tRNA dimethylallyltransferase
VNATNNLRPSVSVTEPAAQPRVIVIGGPTAVGKTALGVHLGQRIAAEVVNADSRYLYCGFDVGVAKPDLAERGWVPHHLIDILAPTDDMSLARFQDMAFNTIREITDRGRIPLLVGGTPQYINAVVEGWRIPRVPPNPVFREGLERIARDQGPQVLIDRLRQVDPDSAIRTGNNLRRVIRALEVFESTGIAMSHQQGKGPPPFNALEIALTMSRDNLRAAIDRRINDQIDRGLIDEVQALLRGGVPENAPAMSSIGYRQLLPYLRGETTLDAAVERIRADTHRYLRHQETWLRKNPRLTWYDTSQPGWRERVTRQVETFLELPEVSSRSPQE